MSSGDREPTVEAGSRRATSSLSYYDRPIIKEPVWKHEIPTYFFLGGLAGASAALSAAARTRGNESLARRSLYTAFVGISITPYLLIRDLGRPRRFYNMLRVFKVTSPMSVGTWILSAEGTATAVAALCELTGLLPRTKAAAHAVAGGLGPAMASYTGALVADSVVPIWHEGRGELPLVFAASSAAAAGGAAVILTPGPVAGPARRLGIFGALAVVLLTRVMEKRMGELVAEPYRQGEGGTFARIAKAASLAGAGLMAVVGKRRPGAIVAGTLLLAGSWAERFAVYHAGKASAADPKYTSLPQKNHAEQGGSPAVTR